ncbi:MBL fold metallo-hydrolase [Rhodobacteraceae bacterium RKSG542]|uniref:MBL fold metallo-hydrolase n=1 Tax=Pseudovibrio flavus TaxID=2529854 RepID=UPI0012BCBE9E|nr:MBL fold metallo-hydrolase [Pseudovibrio flavus]MTI17450.1 MBL fold metallo-hydrolase [Pseudovibrio flavus]
MGSQTEFTILGCGSSTGVPRINGDWGACDPNEPKNRRRRCALLVEKKSESGKTTIVVDTGPDIREQFLSAGVKTIDAVLYTHAHADHIHGIDDLRFFAMIERRRIPVYMDEPTSARVRHAFDYCFRTPEGSKYPPIMDEHRILPDVWFSIDGEGGAIEALPFTLNHGDIDALGFRFGNLAYTPDLNGIPPQAEEALKGLDVWIVDSLRRAPHQSHFCLDDALRWADKLQPAKVILTNMHSDLDYNELAASLPAGIIPAHDQMKVIV